MFLQFYGLKEQPFGMTADSRFVYLGPQQQEALAALYCGVTLGRSVLAIIGPAGTGKTTLVRHLMNRLRGSARTIYLFQTQCDHVEFLEFFLDALGINRAPTPATIQHYVVKLLADERQRGRRCLLAVDEAQNLPDDTFETLRLLSNLESQEGKLVQIILSGQAVLGDALGRASLAALRQRVGVFARLGPLPVREVADYIGHRLRVAGYSGPPLFGADAIGAIAQASAGVPRVVDNLCFGALLLGAALGRRQITREMIAEVIEDLALPALPARDDQSDLDPMNLFAVASEDWKAG